MQTSFVTVFSGSIANQPEQLCNARDLHATLKVETRFDTWITRRIAEYGFEKDQDYIVVSAKRATGAGKGRTDYHLTLDTAKELAMVEKTEVGRQIRRYFIRCEKELRGSGSLKITSAQKQQIQAAVNARVRRTGQTHQAVYTIVHQLAQVASYHDIAAADFDKVMDCLNGEILDKETPPAAPAYPRNLLPLLKHAEYVFQWLMYHEPAIRLFNNTLAGNLIGRVRDGYFCAYDTAQKIGFTMQSHEYWRGYPYDGNYDTVCRYRELNAV